MPALQRRASQTCCHQLVGPCTHPALLLRCSWACTATLTLSPGAVWAIGRRLLVTSLLGEVTPLLAALHRVFAILPAAAALAACPAWLPPLANGREAEVRLLPLVAEGCNLYSACI